MVTPHSVPSVVAWLPPHGDARKRLPDRLIADYAADRTGNVRAVLEGGSLCYHRLRHETATFEAEGQGAAAADAAQGKRAVSPSGQYRLLRERPDPAPARRAGVETVMD